MWKSAFLLRNATEIYPQANVKESDVFHRGCGSNFPRSLLHRKFLHIPQTLWRNFEIKRVYVTFLSLNKKVTKEVSLRGVVCRAHLRAKSRALPGCAPKRVCGRSRAPKP